MLAVVAALAATACGRSQSAPAAGPSPTASPPSSSAPADQALQSLPYLQAYRRAEDRPVISSYDRAAAFDGLNFYVSGHAAEATLVDMQGRTVHRWRYPLRRLWPQLARRPRAARLDYWRHAQPLDDGRLLAIFDGLGVLALDRDSHLLWSRRSGAHHDLFVDEAGNVHLLERTSRKVPRVHNGKPILDDVVTTLDPQGRVLRRISILDAFARSPFAGLLAAVPPRHKDIFHTNALEPLDGRFARRIPAFARGNLLISIRELDALAVLDPRSQQIVWALKGAWKRQHSPVLVGGGDLLLFDNVGVADGTARVLQVDPRSGATTWSYGGAGRDVLSSDTLGFVQRLPNGNTLITESHRGRALEVTPEGRVVWEFYNPHRMGEHGELVAALYEMVRLPRELPFLAAQASARGARAQ